MPNYKEEVERVIVESCQSLAGQNLMGPPDYRLYKELLETWKQAVFLS